MYTFLRKIPNLTVTVSAIEQLQVLASKRQYKEASAQLEVCNALMIHMCMCVLPMILFNILFIFYTYMTHAATTTILCLFILLYGGFLLLSCYDREKMILINNVFISYIKIYMTHASCYHTHLMFVHSFIWRIFATFFLRSRKNDFDQ